MILRGTVAPLPGFRETSVRKRERKKKKKPRNSQAGLFLCLLSLLSTQSPEKEVNGTFRALLPGKASIDSRTVSDGGRPHRLLGASVHQGQLERWGLLEEGLEVPLHLRHRQGKFQFLQVKSKRANVGKTRASRPAV